MTKLDTRILVDATEEIIAHLRRDLPLDSLWDQAVHAHEHGVPLTELGRLVFDERAKRSQG